MGYQESWLYIEPQHKFRKLIQAYEKAEQSGYYEVAGAEPHSVIVLKQPFGDIPAGKKLLWVCGDRGFHCAAGVFGSVPGGSTRAARIPGGASACGTIFAGSPAPGPGKDQQAVLHFCDHRTGCPGSVTPVLRLYR